MSSVFQAKQATNDFRITSRAFEVIGKKKSWGLSLWRLEGSDSMVASVVPAVVLIVRLQNAEEPCWPMKRRQRRSAQKATQRQKTITLPLQC